MRSFFVYPVLMALLLLSATAGAQSFLKIYTNQSGQDQTVHSIFSYPNGDIGLTLQHQWADTSFRLLRTNSDGEFQSLSSAVLPDHFIHYLEQNGSLISAVGINDSLVVWKYLADGSLLWRQVTPLATLGEVNVLRNITENEAGDIFIRGWHYNSATPHFQYYVAKFDPNGVLQWVNNEITNDYSEAISVEPDPSGGCLAGWWIIDTMLGAPAPFYNGLWRYNSDGSTAWSIKAPGQLGYDYLQRGYASNAAGQSLVVSSNDQQSVADSFYWMLLGPAGDTLWSLNSLTVPGIELLRPHLVLPSGDTAFVVVGTYEDTPTNQYIATVAKIKVDGSMEWVRTFGPLSTPPNQLSYFHSGRILSDGSILTAGVSGDNIFLLKISPDGAFDGFQNKVQGHVAYDFDLNCTIDPGDTPGAGWVVTAQTADYQSYGSTDANGFYQIPYIDTGAYQIILTPPNYLWQACQDTVDLYFPFSGATPIVDTADFSVQTPAYCPLMSVDLTAWNLRSCTYRPMLATICNNGPATAAPMQLTVVLDPLLNMYGANHPYMVNGDTVVFAPDTLISLACKTYEFWVQVSCDAVVGQTLCTTAHISPDTMCMAPQNWSGASIQVSAACEGDSVRFAIKNIGAAPTSQDLDFVIIDDHVITRMGQFNLQPEETHQEAVYASGDTWRLTAEQEPGHPFDQFKPSVAVEGCSVPGPFSTGMVNLFTNYTGNPFEDIECREVTGSYDPNDKIGWPVGLNDEHCIEANQALDYIVRFQNTGTDTAFYVEIQDTLSPWLDPASIRSVTASHPFHWSLSGDGIVKFIFDPIALPDSNVSEIGSQGFVRFLIAQRPGNPLGAQLENRAGIYFDQNEVVLTNTTLHTICENYIHIDLVPVNTPERSAGRLVISPNPAAQDLRVQVDVAVFTGGKIRLLDVYGRVLWQQTAMTNNLTIRRNGLANGLYFVEFEADNGERMVQRVVFE